KSPLCGIDARQVRDHGPQRPGGARRCCVAATGHRRGGGEIQREVPRRPDCRRLAHHVGRGHVCVTLESQMEARLAVTDASALDVSDIQATVLRPRPRPYKGEYVILRIDDAAQGREMVRRLLPHVAPADAWWEPSLPGWLGIAFTHHGLEAL